MQTWHMGPAHHSTLQRVSDTAKMLALLLVNQVKQIKPLIRYQV